MPKQESEGRRGEEESLGVRVSGFICNRGNQLSNLPSCERSFLRGGAKIN